MWPIHQQIIVLAKNTISKVGPEHRDFLHIANCDDLMLSIMAHLLLLYDFSTNTVKVLVNLWFVEQTSFV